MQYSENHKTDVIKQKLGPYLLFCFFAETNIK